MKNKPKELEKITFWEEELDLPIFHATLHILIMKDIVDFKEYYKHLTKIPYVPAIDNTWYAFAENATDPDGCPHIFVVFPEHAPPYVWVHEAVHAVNKIFKAAGQNLDLSNDEIQAYYTEYIFEQISKQFEEKAKSEKKKVKSKLKTKTF